MGPELVLLVPKILTSHITSILEMFEKTGDSLRQGFWIKFELLALCVPGKTKPSERCLPMYAQTRQLDTHKEIKTKCFERIPNIFDYSGRKYWLIFWPRVYMQSSKSSVVAVDIDFSGHFDKLYCFVENCFRWSHSIQCSLFKRFSFIR